MKTMTQDNVTEWSDVIELFREKGVASISIECAGGLTRMNSIIFKIKGKGEGEKRGFVEVGTNFMNDDPLGVFVKAVEEWERTVSATEGE